MVKNPGGNAEHLRYSNLDSTNGFFPSATLSGPIIKNRLWFLGSYTPQYYDFERTVPYRTMDSVTYRLTQKNDYAFGRIDAQPFDSLRVSSTYVWNPIAQSVPVTCTFKSVRYGSSK
ncbi:MAG: hypothetical protein R2681_15085 [Pyrinomonadaceae bacterium]